ncbi:MAG: DNA-binding domain-containing protein [Burkholderiales bacterium]|nr:DNA-binding domain-containing protein [Burkholderiales bacterium]
MLRETQTAFAASLIAGDSTAGSRIRAGKLPSARRLEIYRHNVMSNLRGVLKDIYPVIFAVVGDAFFLHAADQFILTHPSRSGDLNQFGGDWSAFLATYPHATDLPYLPDVATLEWAWHEAFHARDAPAFELGRLAGIPAEEHGELRFMLHPAVRLLQSRFPILRIWEVNQASHAGEMVVDWDSPAKSLMIHRDVADGVSVLIDQISDPGYAFLQALRTCATLGEAATVALDIDATFDLQGFLLESVQSGVIVDFVRERL